MRVSFPQLFFVVMVLFLQACATPDPRVSYPRKPAPKPVPEQPVVRATPMEIPRPVQARPLPPRGMVDPAMNQQAPVKSVPVVLGLMEAAQTFENAGQYDKAAARIERGLRISPKDALLWQRLAEIRLQQKRYRQVVATAKKSNGFARGNSPIQFKNWLLIEKAREAMGDIPGADRAKTKASRYQSF